MGVRQPLQGPSSQVSGQEAYLPQPSGMIVICYVGAYGYRSISPVLSGSRTWLCGYPAEWCCCCGSTVIPEGLRSEAAWAPEDVK